MSVKRILFVDDRKKEAENLDRIIDFLPDEWEPEIVPDVDRARESLKQNNFDIIVSEIDPGGISGIDFLSETAREYPCLIRYILSSKGDRRQILKGAGWIHQFIAKPCPPKKFNALIENSLALHRMINSRDLQARIAAVGSLPSPPRIYNRLIAELQSEEASVSRIADIIKQDIGITAKLLQVVNSAYFGLSTPANNPLQAVNILGLDTVKSLVMATGLFEQFHESESSEFSLDTIFNNCLAVGTTARLLATALGLDAKATDDALLAGMLHDVGKLVMLTSFREELDNSAFMAREKSIPLYRAQKEIIGISDAEIGACLLSLWGLPETVIEAAAYHYTPGKSATAMINVLTCVHLAYAFHRESSSRNSDSSTEHLDTRYLENLGLADQVEDLYKLCMGSMAAC